MKCVNSINVTPSSITLKQGTWYYGLNATVCPSDADCKSVKWTSNNSNVASVNASSGFVYCNSAGTARITATAVDGSGVSDSCTITVSGTIPVSSVTLNRSSISLEKGECYSLSATVCPTNATNDNVNWTSSNNNVATVCDGVITAISKGSATVTATAADGSGYCDCCTVTVTESILVSSIILTKETGKMTVGSSFLFEAKVCPTNAECTDISWSSSDESVIQINQNSGLAYAVSPGNAVIYASASDGGGAIADCFVTVNSVILIENLNMYKGDLTLYVGESDYARVAILPPDASNQRLRWSSCNPEIAEVNHNNGCVCGVSPGTTTICVCAKDGSEAESSCNVTVVPLPPLESITVTHSTKTVRKGGTTQVLATLCPCNAENKSITWSSSDEEIATVDPVFGIVTGLEYGTVEITATSNDGTISGSITMTVVIENVTIERDGDNYNKIVFERSRKTWYCINRDMINDTNYNDNAYDGTDELTYRQMRNSCINPEIINGFLVYDGLKTYTDDEMRLIYAIDPHGLAAHIRFYALEAFDGGWDSLNYKDRVYRMLFNKDVVNHYVRDSVDNWYVDNENQNYLHVISESEFIFGRHLLFDKTSQAQMLSVVIDVFTSIFGFAISHTIDTVLEVSKWICNVMVTGKALDLRKIPENIFNDGAEQIYKEFSMSWAYDLFSSYDSLDDLLNVFSNQPTIYKDVFNYCSNNLKYGIFVKFKNREVKNLGDVGVLLP